MKEAQDCFISIPKDQTSASSAMVMVKGLS